VGKKGIVLKDNTNTPSGGICKELFVENRDVLYAERALICLFEACKNAQSSSFSAATFAQQSYYFALLDLHGEAIQRRFL
jgi:hypothetical protein